MFTIPTTILLCLYAAFLCYLLIRLLLFSPAVPSPPLDLPSLSVVVPFKNEADNLDALCASLRAQDFRGAWEVVLVNDGSDDDYAAAADRFRARFGTRFVCVDSAFDETKNLTSKQQAIDKGIETAGYDWIVLTDADMMFAPDWLSSLAANAAAGSDLVFGRTSMHSAESVTHGGLFGFLQRFQLEFLFSAAYAFYAAGLGTSCMGNNILVRKKAYRELGGQKAVGYSIVEDMDLYAAFRRRGYRAAPQAPFIARAWTSPCETAGLWYHQMLRWARGGFSHNPLLLCAALLFTFQNITLAASCFWRVDGAVGVLAAANFLLTMLYAATAFRKTRSDGNALFFPIYLVFALVEAFVFCISFVITPRVRWKKNSV
jgi:cellulose synthase/poly-beta-1,6-N-acetylglucosamine synthase-like glycosyltransferase